MEALPWVMLAFALGLICGALIWAYVVASRKPRCRHDRMELHSYMPYVNTTYLHGICLECGEPVKFNLGFVADSDGARKRAATATLLTLGYNNPDADNTFIRTPKEQTA